MDGEFIYILIWRRRNTSEICLQLQRLEDDKVCFWSAVTLLLAFSFCMYVCYHVCIVGVWMLWGGGKGGVGLGEWEEELISFWAREFKDNISK